MTRGRAWGDLVDREGGPTLFAVANEEVPLPRELRRHEHARGQLFASSMGLLAVETEAGRWLMPPDCGVWIPPGQRHGAVAQGATSGWSLYVSAAASRRLPASPVVVRVTALLREAIARAATWVPKGRALTLAEERVADVIVDEIRSAPRERLHLPMPRTPSLVSVASRLVAVPDDPRGLAAWAKGAGMSPRSFTRHFRAETRVPFSAWRAQLRMLVAVERLAAGESVSRVGAALGYQSPSAFTAAFRRMLGASPTRFGREE
ncbi:MAG TPA: helix-turn-helix transcriptional regulator [Polyangiaceae bacterium]